jgi:hypothetical protein
MSKHFVSSTNCTKVADGIATLVQEVLAGARQSKNVEVQDVVRPNTVAIDVMQHAQARVGVNLGGGGVHGGSFGSCCSVSPVSVCSRSNRIPDQSSTNKELSMHI